VLIDLVVIWYFWVRLHSDRPIEWVPRKAKMYLGGAGTLCVVIFSIYLATFPGEWMKTHLPQLSSLQALLFEGNVDEVSGRPLSVFSNRLVLTNQSIVIDPEKLDKVTVSHSFRGRDLRLGVLNFADLRKADFTGAQLQGASLIGAQLQGALLNVAQLQGASLNDAQLQGAALYRAQLQGATLIVAQLQGAGLDEAQLQGATLIVAQLQGASLDDAQLQGALLNVAQLQGASLYRAQLQGASLYGAQLQGASLNDAQLQGAWLEVAEVWRARGRPRVNLADVAKFDPDTMPWTRTNSTFAAWRDAILEKIPGTDRNQALEKRLSALDPAQKEPEDVVKTEFWDKAFSAPPQGEEREKQLAAFLIALGCSSNGAPYVARGLIRILIRILQRSQVPAFADRLYPAFADRLYKGKSDPSVCPGVKGFTDEDWANLSKLSPDSRMSREGEEKWR
jgi:uncharacterized protein YjbI with pentapeptide repeats